MANRASRISDLFPYQSEVADELCVIRSLHGDMVVHSAAQYQMMTGRIIPGFPAMGSWVVYGLGSQADNLPAYVGDAGFAWRAGSGSAHVY